MNMDDLGRLLTMERDCEALQELPAGFRPDAKGYLCQLALSMQETADYRELGMLRDEERNARMLLEGLEKRRLAKLLNMAVLHVDGNNGVAMSGLHGEDRQAFDLMVEALASAKRLIRVEVA